MNLVPLCKEKLNDMEEEIRLFAKTQNVGFDEARDAAAKEHGFENVKEWDADIVKNIFNETKHVDALLSESEYLLDEEINFINESDERIIACLKELIISLPDIKDQNERVKRAALNVSVIAFMSIREPSIDDYQLAVWRYFDIIGEKDGAHLPLYVLRRIKEKAIEKNVVSIDYKMPVKVALNEYHEAVFDQSREASSILSGFTFK